MKTHLLRVAVALVLSAGAFSCAPMHKSSPPPQAAAPSYSCATCGGAYERSGNCPKCGVELTLKRGSTEMRGK